MTRKPLHPDPDKLTREEHDVVEDLLFRAQMDHQRRATDTAESEALRHVYLESLEASRACAKARAILQELGLQTPHCDKLQR